MPSLLFVDDEPNVLSGLRRMLRSHRREWDMAFCESGAAALKHLGGSPVDVIVSDMRMPGMDGAEFLTRVRELYPDTVRIILSGHSDRELTLRAIGPAHQYLAKPCEPDRLTATIRTALELHKRVRSDAMRSVVESIDALPTIPEVYLELVSEMTNPGSSAETAGRIVAQDLGMSTRILQLVNSSFFGLPIRVSDVPHAVALLGLGVIRGLVLSTSVFGQFKGHELGGFSLRQLSAHSTRVAMRCRELAEAESLALTTDEASDFFLAGLLHDVGRIVLAQSRPGDYADLCRTVAAKPADAIAYETELFGVSHAEVGGYLLQLWGLPSPLVEAVTLHHDPSSTRSDAFGPLAALHAAEVITDREADWDETYLARLGIADAPMRWTPEEAVASL